MNWIKECSAAALFAATTVMAGEVVFESDFKDIGKPPKGWESQDKNLGWMLNRFKTMTEDGVTFIRVSETPAAIIKQMDVNPGWKKLKMSAKVRRTNIKPGDQPWFVPSFGIDFKDIVGNNLKSGNWGMWMPDDSQGWETRETVYTIPEKSKKMQLVLGFKPHSGVVDFADVKVELIEGKTEFVPVNENLVYDKNSKSPVSKYDFSQVTGAQIDESKAKTVVYVDGSVAVSGNGSKEKPFKTVTEGFNRSAELLGQKVDTKLLIQPGTYREGKMTMRGPQDQLNQPVFVMEAAKKGTVTISGSTLYPEQVWTAHQDSNGGVYYSTEWNHDFGFGPGGWTIYNPKEIIEHRREMVFVNGVPLRQLMLENYKFDPRDMKGKTDSFPGVPQEVSKYGTYKYLGKNDPSKLPAGTFGVMERPENGDRLYMRLPKGVALKGAKIEVADKEHLLWFFDKSNVVLRGINFQHCAGGIEAYKTVMFGCWYRPQSAGAWDGSNVLVEDCNFTYNNNNQLSFTCVKNVTLRRNRMMYGAYGGMVLDFCHNLLMEDNNTSFNNWRVEAGWASGPIKIHNLISAVIRNHTSIGTHTGPGLWFDVSCGNVLVENALLLGNRLGLDWEIAKGLIVRDSIISGNYQANMVIVSGSDVVIENTIFDGSPTLGHLAFQASERESHKKIYVELGLEDEMPELYKLDRLELNGCSFASRPQKAGRFETPDHNAIIKVGHMPSFLFQHHGGPDTYKKFIETGVLSIGNNWWTQDPKPFTKMKLYHGGDWREKSPICVQITHDEWDQMTGEKDCTKFEPGFVDPEGYDFTLKADSPLAKMDLPKYKMSPALKKEMKYFFSAPYRNDKSSHVHDVVVTEN